MTLNQLKVSRITESVRYYGDTSTLNQVSNFNGLVLAVYYGHKIQGLQFKLSCGVQTLLWSQEFVIFDKSLKKHGTNKTFCYF